MGDKPEPGRSTGAGRARGAAAGGRAGAQPHGRAAQGRRSWEQAEWAARAGERQGAAHVPKAPGHQGTDRES